MTNPTLAAAGADALRADLINDLREVFDSTGTETTQAVRDVIEYADSWLRVYVQKCFDQASAAQPPEGYVMVPIELAERVQETMGEFLMDHGWRQQDMDTSDEFGALLAAAPKTEPVPGIVDRLEAALKRIDDGHAIRRIPADPTDPDLVLAECKAFFEGRPAPFWVKAEPVQSERVPLTLRQREALAICTESRKVSVSEVQRKLKCSYAQAQELCQSLVDYGGLVDGFVISPAIQPAHKEQSNG